MNKAMLMGRLTKDPDMRVAQQSQMAVARFTLAVDRGGKDRGADFISCVAFDKPAVSLEKYVGKGKKIAVEGHIRTGSYKAQDGRTVYTTDVVVDRWEFAESKQSGENRSVDPMTNTDGFMAVDPGLDELPFE